MKTTLQVILTAVLLFAAGYYVAYLLEPSETHVHGWGKWETDKTGHNGWGQPAVEQHRVCTNCGYLQSEIH